MAKEKIAITLDKRSIGELDRLVDNNVFKSRSQVIQEAVNEKLLHVKRRRLTTGWAKLDRTFEKDLSEEGFTQDMRQRPEY